MNDADHLKYDQLYQRRYAPRVVGMPGMSGRHGRNTHRAEEIFKRELNVPLFHALSEEELNALTRVFEKRHPITHNLGVVDKKYIERARTAEMEGREILVNVDEINSAIDFSMRIFSAVHSNLFNENG